MEQSACRPKTTEGGDKKAKEKTPEIRMPSTIVMNANSVLAKKEAFLANLERNPFYRKADCIVVTETKLQNASEEKMTKLWREYVDTLFNWLNAYYIETKPQLSNEGTKISQATSYPVTELENAWKEPLTSVRHSLSKSTTLKQLNDLWLAYAGKMTIRWYKEANHKTAYKKLDELMKRLTALCETYESTVRAILWYEEADHKTEHTKLDELKKQSETYGNAVTDLLTADADADFCRDIEENHNFWTFRCDRHMSSSGTTASGGVMWLINKTWCKENPADLPTRVGEDRRYFHKEEDKQIRCVEIAHVTCSPERSLPVKLIGVYITPSPPTLKTYEQDQALEMIGTITDKFRKDKPDCPIIIAGDFNRTLLTDSRFYPHIDIPTRNGVILDQCYSNCQFAYFNPIQLLQMPQQDHHPIYLQPIESSDKTRREKLKERYLIKTREAAEQELLAWRIRQLLGEISSYAQKKMTRASTLRRDELQSELESLKGSSKSPAVIVVYQDYTTDNLQLGNLQIN